jgi:hypothetical protein
MSVYVSCTVSGYLGQIMISSMGCSDLLPHLPVASSIILFSKETHGPNLELL